MGKVRKKGMRKGNLKRFSSQQINKGAYAPHKPTLSEMSRRAQSLGSINHKTGEVQNHRLELPQTKGMTLPMHERVARLHKYWQEENKKIRLEDIQVVKEFDGHRHLFRLCVVSSTNIWFWFHRDKRRGTLRRSVIYPSAVRAMVVFQAAGITWAVSEDK